MKNNRYKIHTWIVILSLVVALGTPNYLGAGHGSRQTTAGEERPTASERKASKSKKSGETDPGDQTPEEKPKVKEPAESPEEKKETSAPSEEKKDQETGSKEESKESSEPGQENPSGEETRGGEHESSAPESKESSDESSGSEESSKQEESEASESGSSAETDPASETESSEKETGETGETGETESRDPEEETPAEDETPQESETPLESEGEEDLEEQEREREREREKEKEREREKELEQTEESGETSEENLERKAEVTAPDGERLDNEDPLETEIEEMDISEETETVDTLEGEEEFYEPIFAGSYEILDVVIPTEYRFIKIDKTPVILKNGAAIRAFKDPEGLLVGEARGDALAYLIEDGDDWAYIEAGYVRGFVRKSDITEGNPAKNFYQKVVSWSREHIGQDVKSPFGRVLEILDHMDNPAFAYSRMTTMEVTAPKLYALALETVRVYDTESWVDLDLQAQQGLVEKDPEKEQLHTVGVLNPGDLAYILVASENILYVESGNVRGFIRRNALETGELVNQKVEAAGEYDMNLATEVMEPENNRAFYYTVLSVIKAGTGLRESVVAFALQFVGNPYVWGGTSLTRGTDCSGFVQSVYRYFGYHLPRTSAAMRRYGVNVGTNLEDALPGDLICYNGHVAMYIGGGKIVHASNSAPYPRGGIKVSKNGAYRQILTIRRVIK